MILRGQILSVLRACGGMTADECADTLGESIMAVRPIYSDLKREGRILPSGERRLNISGRMAHVFYAAPKGKQP